MKILVVDDEKLLVKGIKFNLENEGYTVDTASDGEAAVEMAREGDYALIILDLMMPKKDGLEACQEIRSFSTVPIIMLTARSEDADKLMGFESGADDYVTKPFNILELKARVRALIRRASIAAPAAAAADAALRCGHITLDEKRRSAFKDDLGCLYFKGLLGIRSSHKLAFSYNRCTYVYPCKLLKIFQSVTIHYLKSIKICPVRQREEAKAFGIPV